MTTTADSRGAFGPRGAWIAVALLTALGLALRLPPLGDPLYGDELGTYFMVAHRGLGETLDFVHGPLEVTPPLYFILAWLSAQIGDPATWIRVPSLLAGVATIPLTYLLGSWTLGRAAALIGALLTALSPFLIFFSSEARPYALSALAVLVSALCLLRGAETGRARWWAGYAVAACAAFYLHYTAAIALAAQLVWALWALPRARRAVLLASVAAAVGYVPWAGGLLEDIRDPGSDFIQAIQPFGLEAVVVDVGHWSIGHPFLPLDVVPGALAIALVGAGAAIAVVAAVARLRGRLRRLGGLLRSRSGLIVVLALAMPVGAAVASAIGSSVYIPRNLIASWPAFALVAGALLAAMRGPARAIAMALVVAGLVVADAALLDRDHRRPDYEAAAAYVERTGRGDEAIVEVTSAMPMGYSSLEVSLGKMPGTATADGHPVLRVSGTVLEGTPLPTAAVRKALREAGESVPGGDTMFVVMREEAPGFGRATFPSFTPLLDQIPAGFRREASAHFEGTPGVTVYVYRRDAGSPER